MTMEYYQKVLEITKDYLGPAAERFVDRQINSHLRKPPQELLRTDIPMLALRIRSGLVVLSKDEQLVQEAFRRLTAVADV
jgi:hypothetical protein